jgi:hypothetical protein
MRGAAAGIVALSAVAGLAVGLPAAVGHRPVPTSKCADGSQAVLFKDSWTMIKMPAPLTQIETHAAGGLDGKRLLVSDGRRVMRSADGGCTWAESFDVESDSIPGEGKPLAGNAPSVAQLVFPDGGDRALMLVDGVGRAAASRMLASDDGGVTWTQAGDGLPALGGFRDLVAAPSDAKHLYLTVGYNDTVGEQDTQGLTGGLYASSDGGANWSQRSGGGPIQRLAVDPGNANWLWVVRATHTVERSTDGGTNWAPVTVLPGQAIPWQDVAIARRQGQPATIILAASASLAADVSTIVASQDDGHSWLPLPTDGLGPIAGITFGNSPSQILFVSASDSTAFHGPGIQAFDFGQRRWRDIDDEQLIGFREARSINLDPATRGHPGLLGVELRRDAPGENPPVPDMIARYTPPDPPPADDRLARGPQCAGSAVTPGKRSSGDDLNQDFTDRAKPVTFEPADLTMDLKPGTDSRVPLVAHLPRTLRPLDVYYVINSSESMDKAIDAVYCSADRLAYDLNARGLDAWFGAATYSDRYAERYRRLLDLKPYGPELKGVLDLLFTRRGVEDPLRSALFQTATGAGLDIEDTDTSLPVEGGSQSFHVHVDAGRQADYRDDAVRTAIVIGDAPYVDGTPGEPAREAVVAALQRKHILAIGVEIEPSLQDQALNQNGQSVQKSLELQLQLQYFARGTGALAPVGGVDCNGDGTVDLRQGDPLVCVQPEQGIGESMGNTLLSILEGFKNPQDVRIVPVTRSGLAVSVEGGAVPRADLSHPMDVSGTAVVSCTADQSGSTYPLAFAVLAGKKTIGTLSGSARCGTQPAPRKPKPAHNAVAPPPPPKATPALAPPPAPHAAAVVVPPSPPPAPAPVSSAPAASPSAASAPASAPSTSPVGAAAVAPESSPAPQAATVRTDGSGEHAMVARNRSRAERSTIPPASVITLGLGTILGAGWLVSERARRRRRPALARVYTGRSR